MSLPLILVTGGAGYIGSHTTLELLREYRVLVLDNLCNSSAVVIDRLRQLGGDGLQFVHGDVRDSALLDQIFTRHAIEGVIHFAGLKAVGESVADPLRYFDNNLGSTLALMQAMDKAGVRRLVFSSSATVYGAPDSVPIRESAPLRVTNPYGQTKLMCEEVMRDVMHADKRWTCAILRYFNPVGAHPSGWIGEAPQGEPSNLMPYITQVALGKMPQLNIFGNDYPTPDGTCVRDYIHVVDLARGHLAALRHLERTKDSMTVNLGVGRGVSVKELVDTFSRVTGQHVAYQYTARRPGDVPTCFADTTLARDILGWQAEYDLDKMCEDAWRWQKKNPQGYA